MKGSDLIFVKTPKIPCQFKRKADRGGAPDTQEKCYLQGRTRNRPDSFKHASPGEERQTFQMSLNLKNLNQNIEQIHLKIDCRNNAGALMKQYCFYASLDLKDVYYSVRIHPSFKKCFMFMFHDTF